MSLIHQKVFAQFSKDGVWNLLDLGLGSLKHVKEYLQMKYNEGEAIWRKAIPKEIKTEMRNLKDEVWNKLFTFQDFSSLGSRKEHIVGQDMQDEDPVAVLTNLDQSAIYKNYMLLSGFPFGQFSFYRLFPLSNTFFDTFNYYFSNLQLTKHFSLKFSFF